jgi:hypothetical protein
MQVKADSGRGRQAGRQGQAKVGSGIDRQGHAGPGRQKQARAGEGTGWQASE